MENEHSTIGFIRELLGHKRVALWITTFVFFLAMFAAIQASFLLFKADPSRTRAAFTVEEKQRLTDQLHNNLRGVQELRAAQDALLRQPSDQLSSLQLRLLGNRLEVIEARQIRIERAILNDPIRALELPLLRRDLESIRQANEQSVAAVRQSVDQVYDLSKWLFGALALGVLSLALSSFLGRKGAS